VKERLASVHEKTNVHIWQLTFRNHESLKQTTKHNQEIMRLMQSSKHKQNNKHKQSSKHNQAANIE
jgi:hypothetical protein